MRELNSPKVGSRVLLTMACLVVLIAGLRAAEAVIVPFLLSVFLSMLGIPILGWLRRRGVPQPLAILLVVLGLIVILVVIGVVVGGSINGFTQALPQYQDRLTSLMSSMDRQLQSWGLDVSITAVGDLVNPGQVFQLAGGLLSRLAGIVSNFFLVVLTTVFILTEASGFPGKIQTALGDRGSGLLQLSGVMTQVHRYLVIKTAISLMTGVILGTWVWILGVDFPVLWGLLTFLLNYIPNLGSIMAAVPPVLLALIQPGGGLTLALMVAVGYGTVNVAFGNLVEPRVMGQRLGLSTLVVFASLVFWGWVWGGVGMLLSVPLTMVVKILLESSKELRWIAVLLDKSPEPAR
jgi:AI-2 transport protein TqsA